jgi:hypothetical protein
MARTATGLLAVLVLLPALRAEAKRGAKPADAGSAAAQYKALSDEYARAQKDADKVFAQAKTDQQREKVRADFRKTRSGFVARFLSFAEKHPEDKEALLALFLVLHPDTDAEGGNIDKAVRLILKDHVGSDRLTDPPILRVLAEHDSPAVEKLLRRVADSNPHHAVQAQACLVLAQLFKARAEDAAPEEAAGLTREAERWFTRVVDRYADVKDTAETARGELFEIRLLAVGKTAPDIKGTDGDGRQFKLSDYRGKVVILDFWAGW